MQTPACYKQVLDPVGQVGFKRRPVIGLEQLSMFVMTYNPAQISI